MQLFTGEFPDWSPQASSLWAKTDRSGVQSTEWLNLPQHMMDSAQVGAYLWEHYLSARHREHIQTQLGLTQEESLRLAALLCGAHDVGKASYSFATQIAESARYSFLNDQIRATGLSLPPRVVADMWSPHSAASQTILDRFFSDRYGEGSLRTLSHLGQILGAHHGFPASEDSCSLADQELNGMGQAWVALHEELLTSILRLTQVEPVIEKLLSQKPKFKDTTKMVLAGLVVMADWIASNAAYFPLGLYEPAEQRARFEAGISKLRLPQAWLPEDFSERATADIYTGKFQWDETSSPRPVQVAALDILRGDDPPTMLIIEAPMGEGKTEAALVAAEQLAQLNGCNGVFFGAPTMTTTDSLFKRAGRWAEQSHNSPVVSMYLGHSKNQLNSSYTSLSRFVPYNLDDEERSDSSTSHSTVIAHQWFRGRKQGILSSLVVATVDQVLMMALQSRHLMLRHLGLAGKVIIIDEVHSYDAYMSHYLKSALKWLGSYGAPVILLSATLPHSVKANLVAAYQTGLDDNRRKHPDSVPSAGSSYPVITAVSADTVRVHEIEPSARNTTYEIRPLADDDEELINIMGLVAQNGGCLLVICNTVDRAQSAYQLARSVVGEDAYLLHSRFTALERVRREGALVEELGPGASIGCGRPERRIVVATQVVEQSLDVDFDAMVTDIAPVDLILQRLGRVHRHHRPGSDRPSWARSPQVFVRGMQQLPTQESSPIFSSGIDAVYQPALLLPTCSELAFHKGEPLSLTVPEDIPILVQAVYSDPQVPSGWAKEYQEAEQKCEEDKEQAKGKSEAFKVNPARRVRDFSTLWATQKQDISDERGAAQVRDTEPTIEVVLVQKVGDGYYTPLPWLIEDTESPAIPFGFTPDTDTAYLLAQSTVRLPYQLSRTWILDQVLDELEQTTDIAWQQSHLLKGLLQVILDENYEATIAGFQLRYCQELGLELLNKPHDRKGKE